MTAPLTLVKMEALAKICWIQWPVNAPLVGQETIVTQVSLGGSTNYTISQDGKGPFISQNHRLLSYFKQLNQLHHLLKSNRRFWFDEVLKILFHYKNITLMSTNLFVLNILQECKNDLSCLTRFLKRSSSRLLLFFTIQPKSVRSVRKKCQFLQLKFHK